MATKTIKTALNTTREQDFPAWYQAVIKAADLAENGPVRGSMVIKPWGYGIWEAIQHNLDGKIKATGHQNAYFPLFIPVSRLQKEASHIDGFATECAVVTHSRLSSDNDGLLQPSSPLEEPLVVRPTSETIVGEMFSKWIQSYRDLPLKINQWANVVRWEMRTRLFLRTMEFLWQEGHTAHETAEEAEVHTRRMLDVYIDFITNTMAIPIISGKKTKNERFPGAVETYCIEAMMQDGKALQAGTSHFLGQHFSKAFDIRYLGRDSNEALAWTTSWGMSTRLIGGLIMTHSDDDGLVLPPKIAPSHVVILPLKSKSDEPDALMAYCHQVRDTLSSIYYHGKPLQVIIDDSDARPGEKAWKWVKRGIPMRLEIGPKEYESKSVFIGRRDKAYKDKVALTFDTLVGTIVEQLDYMQRFYYQKALDFSERHTVRVDSSHALYDFFQSQTGFVECYWHEDDAIEAELKQSLKITPRCILYQAEHGPCIFSGKMAPLTVFAKAY